MDIAAVSTMNHSANVKQAVQVSLLRKISDQASSQMNMMLQGLQEANGSQAFSNQGASAPHPNLGSLLDIRV